MAVGIKHPKLLQGPLLPLLGAPEFHEWELARSITDYGQMQMIGWFRQEPFAELAHQWHTMPHRKQYWYSFIQGLFFNVPEIRNFMEQQSRRWEERLTAEPDTRLKFLVPRFRIENYAQQKTDAGMFIAYQVPEALRAESEAFLKQSNETQLKLGFPIRCSSLLDRGISLKPGDLSDFWQNIRRLSELAPDEDEKEYAIGRPEDGVCGGIAVLFTLHRDWLKSNPNAEQWCISEIIRIMQRPPPPGRFAHSEDITPDWQTFSARTIPVLWSENVGNEKWRQFTAVLATSYKYKVVEILFATAASLRKRLGNQFVSLQEFVCDWAVARRQLRQEEFIDKDDGAASWIAKEVAAFALGQRKSKPTPWDGLEVKKPRLSQRHTSALRFSTPNDAVKARTKL